MFKETNKRLKVIRASLNLKRKPIADLLKIKEYKVSDIENGKSSLNEEMIKKLIEKYNINTNWFLFGEGEIFFNNNNEEHRDTNKKIITGNGNTINVNNANNGDLNNNHKNNYNSTKNNYVNKINEITELYKKVTPKEKEFIYQRLKFKALEAEES